MDATRIHQIKKELKDLYRIKMEMEKLATKGSEVDKENLKFAHRGIERCLSELKRLENG